MTLLFSSSRLIPVYFVITRREQNDISALLYMHMNICINIDEIYNIIINIRYRTCWGSEGRGIRLCYRDAQASLKIYWWTFVQRFKSVWRSWWLQYLGDFFSRLSSWKQNKCFDRCMGSVTSRPFTKLWQTDQSTNRQTDRLAHWEVSHSIKILNINCFIVLTPTCLFFCLCMKRFPQSIIMQKLYNISAVNNSRRIF